MREVTSLIQPIVPGRVQHVGARESWATRGFHLLRSCDGGATWVARLSLPASGVSRLKRTTRLARRLFREGVHHLLFAKDSKAIAFAGTSIYTVDVAEGQAREVARVSGSRPLVPCVAEGEVFYGEYRGNPNRLPVHVWGSEDQGRHWESAWEFKNVRHIHAVQKDPYTGSLWVTTGDSDSEAAIWVTEDRFRTLERVTGRSQACRAVQLVFTEEAVYYGSDIPERMNQLYRLERGSGRASPVQTVPGPVFFGCKVGDALFFSTAVEPASASRCRDAEVWWSRDGESWERLLAFRKDVWPMKLFQYGQVFFPHGPGDGKHLWCTPFATAHEQVTLKVELPQNNDLPR